MNLPTVSDETSIGLKTMDGQEEKQVPIKGLQESPDKHFETINAGLRNLHFRILEIEEILKSLTSRKLASRRKR